MDLRERTNDPHEALRSALDARQARMWTAMPGIIQSYDPTTMTCEVKPAVQARITQPIPNTSPPQTQTSLMDFPQLLDCPVVFPSGGNCALVFPLVQGDECLVVFASRGIDFWWQQGGVQPPAEARMHDLSDGFVIPGPFSQPRKIAPSTSTTGTELRSFDGLTSIHLDPNGQTITVKAPNGLTIDGNVTVSGDVVASGISQVHHVHGGVQTGGALTNQPQ